MALSISPEKGLFVKKTVYVDMDGVLVDFNSGVNRLPAKTREDLVGYFGGILGKITI